VGIRADGVRIRGFAGLPDGSEWVADEVAVATGDEIAGRHESAVEGHEVAVATGDAIARRRDETAAGAHEGALTRRHEVASELEAAALSLARRMLAAGAADLLRAAEAMAAA
jgi:hypothetical protein